jgi:hypothetical protein
LKRNGTFSFDFIYDSGQQSGQWWVLFITDDRLCFQALGVAGTCSTQTIIDTNFHQVAVVKNGNTGVNVIVYIDRVFRGQGSVGSLTTPSGPKLIGALLSPNNTY